MLTTIRRKGFGAAAAVLLLCGCAPADELRQDGGASPPPAASPSEAPAAQPPSGAAGDAGRFPYEPSVIAEGLDLPWEIAFAPDGRIFFTERPGALRVIEEGRLREKPLLELPGPDGGEGGLLGLALDPAFADNGYAYAYHSYEERGRVLNRVLRLRIDGEEARIDRVLLGSIPGAVNHNGGRLRFGPDGMLYATTGDASEPELAQDPDSLAGKILRLRPDGSIPADNPFPGSPVYSLGHRNPQGLAWHPESGELYSSEHGQSAHDEINRIRPGANYGWPNVEGDDTGVAADGKPLQVPAAHSGDETWAPSGMAFLTEGPWKGRLLVSALRGERLLQVSLAADGGVSSVAPLFEEEWGRLRSIVEAPDGTLYVLTSNRSRGNPAENDDRILALAPVPPSSP
ncbi:PQQ-dependent sugar dehydrogenase [Paenibacillus albicereus]|uniref:PQQ-dependent sugar dehydrogenase n=1 Tax=Paenibacillus albicereus TaxID=2726185 RepID=A0A6H2GS86_9BACL|nr:PQQ-dependent sugar dehydrogenase [Paenibacillus albicereus]QJC50291.1 PQQ-dependent sugar dehydrogenase [Paenibacillus albicereus]